ncbi:hypothetical protein [Chromobacterium sinusclupearum]|uniref:hypothetical protein n=1 Tax=Chromobacterium sinusclupearum TaxID=2077146 RepID=UPI0011AFAB9D|nr:hypothetical protein [Chromobacterium sinusclupearum]
MFDIAASNASCTSLPLFMAMSATILADSNQLVGWMPHRGDPPLCQGGAIAAANIIATQNTRLSQEALFHCPGLVAWGERPTVHKANSASMPFMTWNTLRMRVYNLLTKCKNH